jgi:endoglucanase
VRYREDPDGNIVLRYRRGSRRVSHPLAVQAHMDHPGFVSLSQSRTGRVQARFLGGVRREFFAGSAVVFHGLETTRARVVSVRKRKAEGDLVATLEAEGTVEPGTIGMWDVPACRIRGEKLETRAADDLTGVTAILCLFEELSRKQPETEVLGVLTRAEEVGFVGAMGLLRHRSIPRKARVVTLECSKALPNARPGDGPVLRVGDRRTIYSPLLTAAIEVVGNELAKAGGGFRYQRKLMDGGACEATAFNVHGFEATGMCLALENYHNMTARGTIGPERIHLGDLAGMIRLLEALATRDLDLTDRDRGTREKLEARYESMAEELARWER